MTDISDLLPSFQTRAQALLDHLEAIGYPAMVRQTRRTPAQAAANVARGTGIADSMHLYGAAMDVVCKFHLWDCHLHGCKFFEMLGDETERLGLVWGGRWRRHDLPHVQCLKVSDQAAFRLLKTDEARDAFVSQRLVEMPNG